MNKASHMRSMNCARNSNGMERNEMKWASDCLMLIAHPYSRTPPSPILLSHFPQKNIILLTFTRTFQNDFFFRMKKRVEKNLEDIYRALVWYANVALNGIWKLFKLVNVFRKMSTEKCKVAKSTETKPKCFGERYSSEYENVD